MEKRLDSKMASGGVHELEHPRGGLMRIPRSRGAASGFLLILLGLWGALIPFVGPYFDFAFSPDRAWVWTDARGWLEVLPGVVTVLGGFLLLTSRNRASATLGGWLAVAGGAWFVVGRAFASTLAIGELGQPAAATPAKAVVLELTFFSGLGALIVFLGALALGRLSIRSVRDIAYAQRAVDKSVPPVAAAPAPAGATAASDAKLTDQKTEVITPATTPQTAEHHRGWRNLFRGNRHSGHRTLVRH